MRGRRPWPWRRPSGPACKSGPRRAIPRPLMSATESRVPSPPNVPAASRQPSGRTPSCLPSSATKICAFCAPNPGSAATRFSSSAPEGRTPRPGRRRRRTARRPAGPCPGPGRPSPWVPVHRRPFGEDRREPVRVELGQLGRGRLVPEPPDQVQRPAERLLQRDLLVEQHGDEQGERAAAQQLVGLRLDRHPDRHGAPRRSALASVQRRRRSPERTPSPKPRPRRSY